MKNKTCGDCKFHCKDGNFCSHHGTRWLTESNGACKDFEPIPKLTNGEKIMQGGNKALLEYYNTHECDICAYYNTGKCDEMCCKDGRLAWLDQEAE